MAINSYLKIEGENQEWIKGENTEANSSVKDWIRCFSSEEMMTVPTDSQSGRATGRKFHKPSVATLEATSSAPKLFQAACTGEKCTITHQFFRVEGGIEHNFFTIKYVNAVIKSQEIHQLDTTNPETAEVPLLQKIEFVFDEVTQTFTEGNVEYTDKLNQDS
ncbi:type VI secretion system tube protein TssD [Vibrio marisflavi]|uniref:Major exported protein n=1 Tax=Vibrio marisflavi CECT 7928 TaxID=634439 RepID=A0ABN8E0A4_9VIBR|nr:type VI secretion system tube protein TssD [Vibrio marisflavi]CAH0536119.1 Major exported protein [Vibrio marisflavi CECT 7928]